MWERLVVALVSALMAALTLLVWSLLLFALLGTPNDDFGIAQFLGANVFSRSGVAIIALAALAAFCAGGDRMAVVFSAPGARIPPGCAAAPTSEKRPGC